MTGIKPTWGRVSRYGAFELAARSITCPMTRSAEDSAAMLGVIAGADDNDPTASQLPVPDYLREMERGVRGCASASTHAGTTMMSTRPRAA